MAVRADEMPKFDQRMTLSLLPVVAVRCYQVAAQRKWDDAMRCDVRQETETWLTALSELLAEAAPTVPAIYCAAADPRFHMPASANVQVLDHLPALAGGAPSKIRELVERFAVLAPSLAWRQTYGTQQADRQFLSRYGWTELVGSKGILQEPGISAGLLLLGPNCHYPAHRHPALEYYVPLSGTARWFDTDLGWRDIPPLQTIVHRSGIDHAMRTFAEPLLAYFHWSGTGVSDQARFSSAD